MKFKKTKAYKQICSYYKGDKAKIAEVSKWVKKYARDWVDYKKFSYLDVDYNSSSLIWLFPWEETPEGVEFWNKIENAPVDKE